MASSNTKMKKYAQECATCLQNSHEQKVKPGSTLCEGCRQTYCLSHYVDHRQALNNKLDDIAGQRDILRAGMKELPTRMSDEHLKMIDDWKNTMLQTVTEAANNAQQQVHELIISEIERDCNELTNKIISFRDNDNCFETDIEKLQTKIEKLNEKLNDLRSLHRIQLNLPTLDCSNMIHIKSFETHSLPEVVENNDTIMLKPKNEYRSFIEDFLKTHKPSIDLSLQISGCICASPTMLIDITYGTVKRIVFPRQSTSTFSSTFSEALDIRWSSWLQQFIVLMNSSIEAVDAIEKASTNVMQENSVTLQHMTLWKHLSLVADDMNRLSLYKMNKELNRWLLLYCWSAPTTCGVNEKITAIGLNEHHIVLSIQCDDQHRFSIHNHDMTYCSNIQLTHPCMTIQALPQGEWLLYDSSKKIYYVIDSELEQHDELYLSSLKDVKLIINCEETDKILLVLQPREVPDKRNTTQRIQVYTQNC